MSVTTAADAADVLDTALRAVTATGADIVQMDAVEAARAFVKIRALRDQIEALVKPFSAFYEDLAKVKIPEIFDRAKVPSITLDEGYRVTVTHNLRASVRGGVDKDLAYKWLEDNGLGDLITTTVNASTLSAAAKEMAEENRELDTDLFNVAIIPNTSFTKVKR